MISPKNAEEIARRAASIPPLTYDPELPITKHREEIIGLLQTRQTIVVCGETGSGKSTQLPKICLDAGLGRSGWIGHTQPRRLAARSVATRVAEELDSKIGELVGYKIRFTDQTSPQTLIKLMTDGVLLAETQHDRFLNQYDTIIIDEAHERSLNIDFLLGYLHRLRRKRPDLRLIITSATIDANRFAEHFDDSFGPAPILEVSGRGYPVEIRYRPLADEDDLVAETSDSSSNDTFQGILRAYDELQTESSGDILVFLPTERDIREASKRLKGHLTRRNEHQRVEILPLYARLTSAEQQRIFQPHGKQRVVLATNVAESSLTVPGIRYVIDTGTARISRYAPRSKVQRLPIEAVARASADQRAGRCGRTSPGICIRLFSQEDYQSRSQFTTPEIRRSDLAAVILQTKMLNLGELEDFPLLDPPPTEMVRDGYRSLHELGAIDADRQLTAIGRRLGRLPVDPRIGRMILAAEEEGCLSEVLIIAAALEGQDVRLRPAEQQQAADQAHGQFADPWSDFLSYLRLWDFYHGLREKLGSNPLQRALHQNFLSFHAFREWSDVQRQLREILTESGIKIPGRKLHLEPLPPRSQDAGQRGAPARGSHSGQPEEKPPRPDKPPHYEAIHRSLLTGLLSGVANRSEKGEYNGADNLKMFLWPGSGLHPFKPTWIVASEVVETSRRFARTVAEIDPAWIEPLAQHIVKRSYSQPHWSSKSQSCLVHERVTLFGLPIIVGRRVALAPIDPEMARTLFIEHGLVDMELKSNAAFFLHNKKLLEQLEELAHRTRKREFVVDRYDILRFYQSNLPIDVADRVALEKWDREHRPKTNVASKNSKSPEGVLQPPADAPSLWMRLEDLVEKIEEKLDAQDFPDQLQIDANKLPLRYCFEPGSENDGVHLTVPSVALAQLSEDRLGWLVPGLLEEKLLALIRSLPKSSRRNLVPAPDVAKWGAEKLRGEFAKRPFYDAVAELFSQRAGEAISREELMGIKIPDHLRMRVEVLDDQGKVVAASRQLDELRKELPANIASRVEASRETVVDGQWHRDGLTEFIYPELPVSVPTKRAGMTVVLFPAIVDQGETVGLRLVDRPEEAVQLSQRGWLRLFAIKEKRELKKQVSHLPKWSQVQILSASWMPAEKLKQNLSDLIARKAYLEDQPPLRSRAEFDKRVAQGGRVVAATQEVSVWLPSFFEKYHQVRLLLEKAPAPWKEAAEDVRQQLSRLMHPECLIETPWKWLTHFPRYLSSIVQRFEKLKSGGGAKDRTMKQQVDRFWSDYVRRADAAQNQVQDENLILFRWMIEEYRVSLFSQQLGTSVPVSEKRLEKIQQELPPFVAKAVVKPESKDQPIKRILR